MRLIISIIILSFIFLTGVYAENMELNCKGEKITGIESTSLPDTWEFEAGNKTYILINKKDLADMMEKIETYKAIKEHSNKVIEAKDKIIAKTDEFERKADENIKAQKEMAETAEKLYTGYKDLYHDLKSIVLVTDFSITPSIGFLYFSENSPAPYGALGFGYKNLFAQISYGRKFGTKYDRNFNTSFGGFQVGWRIPIM